MPSELARIVGQEAAVRQLLYGIQSDKIAHAYLFSGPPGCGRFTTAIAMARTLLCDDAACEARVSRLVHPDLHILEPEGENILIDQIREVISESQLTPMEGKRRVFILPHAEKLNQTAANAFLKTLEEPEAGNVFILLTTDPDTMLATIVSRCQVVNFKRLIPDDLLQIAAQIDLDDGGDFMDTAAQNNYSLERCIQALNDKTFEKKRSLVREFLMKYEGSFDDAIGFVEALRGLMEEQDAELKSRHKQDLADLSETYGDDKGMARMKQRMMDRHKRIERSSRFQQVLQVLAMMTGWFRDIIAVRSGALEQVVNRDWHDALSKKAENLDTASTMASLEAIHEIRRVLSYNVTEQFALECLLIKIGGFNAGSSRRFI